LSIDEIRQMAAACPPGLGLEVFVHGALCYGVSGRCYWSSYLGGKSGLRGRCVQPCRRFFSCQDLSLDVLVKVLAEVDRVKAWKIEGRKKSPHYVYHTVKAYRLLRDFGTDPAARADARKEALRLLAGALGRTANHFRFLPQRPWHPIQTAAQTGSGLMLGNLRGASSKAFLLPRQELLAGDLLRLGYEDDPRHRLVRVRRFVPAGGRLGISAPRRQPVTPDAPVFLIDRRDSELKEALAGLTRRLDGRPPALIDESPFSVRLPRPAAGRQAVMDISVHRMPVPGRGAGTIGLWLSGDALARTPAGKAAAVWWWLPPVVWPENENEIASLVADSRAKGGQRYVINAPWQASYLQGHRNLTFWAGPFCNAANPLALEFLAGLGAAGAMVSPELGRQDLAALPGLSPLPLGIVLSGSWPLCISRVLAEDAATDTLLLSPKKEGAWARRYGADFWLYPDWQLDLGKERTQLQRAGYKLFVHLVEVPPKGVRLNERPGLWNWRLDLR
jgi:putative protease